MTVGIVGLGLIGGSFAKAYHETGHRVLAYDTDAAILEFAQMNGTVDGVLTQETISTCNLVLIAIFPQAAVSYLKEMAPYIGEKPVVVDCCGVKRKVCEACFPLAREHHFTFMGGHPMAGTHYSGFKHSRATMFHGAPMVLVPEDFDDILLLGRVEELLAPAGFGRFSVTTAQKHDEMIAFTSQLAHLVSNAYIKSPTAGSHKGFSAGSYNDMTRVAWLSPDMWAELFLGNKDFLMEELDVLVAELLRYRKAMEEDDLSGMITLLDDGRRRKAEVDGR